jgi:haloacetate dehalogenase
VDLEHLTLDVGHFMAEEAPADIVEIIRNLLTR